MMTHTKTAIVIGGSMAGLLAARVLSDHFDRVLMIERDTFPSSPGPRRGTPQARHFHVLLMRGQRILEEFFPGLKQELIGGGAEILDAAGDLAWLTPFGWGVRFRSGLEKLAMSRELLDWMLLRRMKRDQRITILERTEVSGISLRSQRVHEVFIRNLEDGSADVLRGDLLVDAAGRRSRMPRWLQELGQPVPQEWIVNAHLGYASRIYRRTEFPQDWKALYVQAAPPRLPRAGVLFPIDGGRWMLSLGGGSRQYPPADETGFMEFVRQLPAKEMYDTVRTLEPLSPISVYRATENRWRRWDRLPHQPHNLIALGDSFCAFNPVYGQGMTIAALGALTLQQCLLRDHTRSNFAADFQRKLADTCRLPWMLATSEDLRYEGAMGAKCDMRTRWMHQFMDRVVQAGTREIEVRRVFLEIQHMLASPSTLIRPGILRSILRRPPSIRNRTAPAATVLPDSCCENE